MTIKIVEDRGDLVLTHVRENPYEDDGLEYPDFELDIADQEDLIKWLWLNRSDVMVRIHQELVGLAPRINTDGEEDD